MILENVLVADIQEDTASKMIKMVYHINRI